MDEAEKERSNNVARATAFSTRVLEVNNVHSNTLLLDVSPNGNSEANAGEQHISTNQIEAEGSALVRMAHHYVPLRTDVH